MATRVRRHKGAFEVGEGNSSAVDATLTGAMDKYRMNVVIDEASWSIKQRAADWRNIRSFWHAKGWEQYRDQLSEHYWRQVRKTVREFEALLGSTNGSEEELHRLEELMLKIWGIVRRGESKV